jgi:hypothetical protein
MGTSLQDVEQLLDQLPDREWLLRFFVLFSRFEFALKRTGRLEARSSRAKPDWNTFAAALNIETIRDGAAPEVSHAIAFLIEHPPMSQVKVGGGLGWAAHPPVTDAAGLISCIKAVRNNLFHGGKYPMGPVYEPARDGQLLRACLLVLERCLQVGPADLREAFWEVDA